VVDVIDSVTSKKRIRRNREGVGMKASGLALCLWKGWKGMRLGGKLRRCSLAELSGYLSPQVQVL